MSKSISEDIKLRIAELYNNGDLSNSLIAQALGVSERTVQRYKNYNGLDVTRPDYNRKARPNNDKASPMTRPNNKALQDIERSSIISNSDMPDEALDISDKPSPTRIEFVGGSKFSNEEKKEGDIDYNICGSCGAKVEGEPDKCPHCGAEFEYDF